MRRIAAFIALLAFAAPAAAHHSATHEDSVETLISPLWVGPAFSGSWYSPDRSGEGFILQVLDNGSALLLWFTYPPAGSTASLAWIYADGGAVEGDRILFSSAVTTRGGRFGATSGGVQAQRIPWGTVEFRFTSCNAGEVTFAGPAAWGSGTRQLVRLTELAELGCAGRTRISASGARVIEGLRQRSGAWYNPGSDADGWAIEELPTGGALVYWFTHDAAGEQAWTYGEATSSGDRIQVTNYRPMGTRFGSGFDASRVMLTSWGTLDLAFNGCDRGTLGYASLDATFGSGTLAPSRLTTLASAACHAQKPVVPAGGTWSAGATMAVHESEVGTATVGTRTCAVGGYTSQRTFQCYDAATNAWTVLPGLPAGRDHGEAVAHDGSIYFTGGLGENGDAFGWRFDFPSNRWIAVPELPNVAASGATMLNGFAYFGGFNAIYQFNPRTRQVRLIPAAGRAARDHSQLVAFQGELWFIAGRAGTGVVNRVISIFDPASETWRAGPALNTGRSGFAANASGTVLFVAGGEKLDAPVSTIASAEAIAAGDTSWSVIPAPPIAVHGVGSAIHGNAFYTIGGSRVAGTAVNFGDVQVYRFGP
jgi:hypothetical protein